MRFDGELEIKSWDAIYRSIFKRLYEIDPQLMREFKDYKFKKFSRPVLTEHIEEEKDTLSETTDVSWFPLDDTLTLNLSFDTEKIIAILQSVVNYYDEHLGTHYLEDIKFHIVYNYKPKKR